MTTEIEQDKQYFLDKYPDATLPELELFAEKTSICHIDGRLSIDSARAIAERVVLKWRNNAKRDTQ